MTKKQDNNAVGTEIKSDMVNAFTMKLNWNGKIIISISNTFFTQQLLKLSFFILSGAT